MSTNQLTKSVQTLHRKWRALRGKDIVAAPQVECATLTLGNRGAAWTFCPEGLSEGSVVYSLGVGEDISFDLDLIQRFGVTVHAFDPTPRSVTFIRAQVLADQFVFHPYGVAAQDGVRRFTPPKNARYVSHTLLQRESSRGAIEVPVQRLSTIMRTLGHTRIQLLKMDIEGAEYQVLNDLLDSELEVEQLLVEFHHRWPEVGIARTQQTIHQLNASGYRIFTVSASGEEYGFRESIRFDHVQHFPRNIFSVPITRRPMIPGFCRNLVFAGDARLALAWLRIFRNFGASHIYCPQPVRVGARGPPGPAGSATGQSRPQCFATLSRTSLSTATDLFRRIRSPTARFARAYAHDHFRRRIREQFAGAARPGGIRRARCLLSFRPTTLLPESRSGGMCYTAKPGNGHGRSKN